MKNFILATFSILKWMIIQLKLFIGQEPANAGEDEDEDFR